MESSYVPFCKRVKVFYLFFFLLMSNASHPVSLSKLSSDTSFVVPVAILAASVWIFLGHPFHTTSKFRCHTLK